MTGSQLALELALSASDPLQAGSDLVSSVGAVLQLETEFLGQEIQLWLAFLIAAFAGGVIGAGLGPLPSFIMMGFAIMAGEAARLAGFSLGDEAAVPGYTMEIAFGAFLGPHIAFAGGVAASAYAASQGYMVEDFGGNWGYHDAKNIMIAFGSRNTDVLLVGGVFGVVGYLIVFLAESVSVPWDPIAFGVVASAVAHRLVFGYDLIGTVRGDGIFDTGPFEREETHQTDGTGGEPEERLDVEPWLPWHYDWSGITVTGFAFGVAGGLTFYFTGSVFLAFGISAASLVFLELGIDDDYRIFQVQIPVSHHITMPAAVAPAAYAGFETGAEASAVQGELILLEAIALGAIFGVFGSILGEVAQRVLYQHADTHFDPPAVSIVLTTFTIVVLHMAGVFESAGPFPVPI